MFIYSFTYIFKCQLKQLIIWIRNKKMCCKTAYKWRVSVLKQPVWSLQPDMIRKSEVGFFLYIYIFSIAAQHTAVPSVQYVTYKCLVSFMVTLIYNHAGWLGIKHQVTSIFIWLCWWIIGWLCQKVAMTHVFPVTFKDFFLVDGIKKISKTN